MLGFVPGQVQPTSTLQLELQPSPEVALPSSQPSKLAFTPSPHTAHSIPIELILLDEIVPEALDI